MRAAAFVALGLGCHAVAYTDVAVTWKLVGQNGVHVLTCEQVGNPMVTWDFVLDGEDTITIPLGCDESGSVVRVPQGHYMTIDAFAGIGEVIPCMPRHDDPLTQLDLCVLQFTTVM